MSRVTQNVVLKAYGEIALSSRANGLLLGISSVAILLHHKPG